MTLVLSSHAALAQTAPPLSSGQAIAPETNKEKVSSEQLGSAVYTLDAVTIIGTAEEKEKKIGNTAGTSKEDVKWHGASYISDLIDQILGTSINSLYSRPKVSVGVQGIAGYGRVAQSLKGINENFHAFTRNIGQTDSTFVDTQLLRVTDATREGCARTGVPGSLESSVDINYLDLENIFHPGKNSDCMIRGFTGFSKYANGQKPFGSNFLGGHTERWDMLLVIAQSENYAYRIGYSFNREGHAA
ncbi:hypothetical protein [Azorhizophilus paspali]